MLKDQVRAIVLFDDTLYIPNKRIYKIKEGVNSFLDYDYTNI